MNLDSNDQTWLADYVPPEFIMMDAEKEGQETAVTVTIRDNEKELRLWPKLFFYLNLKEGERKVMFDVLRCCFDEATVVSLI